MCDLLGMSFSVPVGASISLDMFQLRGQENPDGWGLAFYEGSQMQLVKEARPALKSPLYDFVESYPESRIFISHVRRSTRGNRSYANTHPFYRILSVNDRRREYALAHNGTLTDMSKLTLSRIFPIGETDSEQLLCFILENLEDKEISEMTPYAFEFLEGLFHEINGVENSLNCMLTDGEYLLCYSDENRHNGGLRYAKQDHPFSGIPLQQDDITLGSVEIRTANIDGDVAVGQMGHIIVTRAMQGETWTEFNPGELIVFRQGKIVYPKNRIDKP